MSRDAATDAYERRVVELLDAVGPKPTHVLTIHESELLALDGPDVQRVTPLLQLTNKVPHELRRRAVEDAAAHLRETERTLDGTPLGGSESQAAEPTVRTVLRMRRSWLGVLLIDQHASIGRQFITVYLRADGLAMTEFASQDGMHRFTLLERAAALDASAQLLTPFPEVRHADGPTTAYDTATWAETAMSRLATAKAVSTVIARRHDREMARRADDRFTVYNFDDRTEILYAESAQRLEMAPSSRETIRARLGAITRPLDLSRAP